MAKDIFEIRRFYLDPLHFWHFCRDILDYKDIRSVPHYELCDFIVNSPGNGSVRNSNNGIILKKKKKVSRVDKRRKLVLAPRNIFKSSILTIGYSLWTLLRDPYKKILIVSYSEKKAQSILNEIENKLRSDKVKLIFGDFTPQGKTEKAYKWNRNEIQLWDAYKGCLVPYSSQMGSVYCAGLGTDIVGLHCDICIGDDLVVKENSQTADARQQVKDFLRYLEAVVNPGGEINLNGTRWHTDDAYKDIIENEDWDVLIRGSFNEDGSLYFPERNSLEVLQAMERHMGSYEFSCNYLNKPINIKDQIFKEEWIERAVRFFSLPSVSQLNIVGYIDPAFSKKKFANRTAIIIAGMNSDGQIWVLDEVVGKFSDDEVVERVYQLDAKWFPHQWGMESNAAQGLFIKIFKLQGEKKGKQLLIKPIEHSTRIDKRARIRSLMPFIERTQIFINPGCYELLSELRHFNLETEESDDCLDALEGAVSMLNPPDIKKQADFGQIRSSYFDEWNKDVVYDKIKSRFFEDRFEDMFL